MVIFVHLCPSYANRVCVIQFASFLWVCNTWFVSMYSSFSVCLFPFLSLSVGLISRWWIIWDSWNSFHTYARDNNVPSQRLYYSTQLSSAQATNVDFSLQMLTFHYKCWLFTINVDFSLESRPFSPQTISVDKYSNFPLITKERRKETSGYIHEIYHSSSVPCMSFAHVRHLMGQRTDWQTHALIESWLQLNL